MNDITAATIAALATIDAELGMSEDGCNSTARTLTAIRLLHSVHLDDVAEIARLERALKLQRNAALTLADASAAVSGARLEQARKLFAESRPESVESERAMNAILTADVERLERELAVVTELRQHGCECSDADACRYARERDAARAEAEALRTALAMMYDKWVDGDDCYEEPDTFSGLLGKAFQLSLTEEDHVISLIGKDCPTRAIDGAIAKEPVQVPAGECPYPIRQDHSIAACVEAGDCGCGEQKP